MREVNYALFVGILLIYIGMVSAGATISYSFNISSQEPQVYSYQEVVRSSSVVIYLVTDKPSVCKYSKNPNLIYEAMENTFEYNFDTVHRQGIMDVQEGVNRYYVLCKSFDGVVSGQLTFSFSASIPVSAKIIFSDAPPFKSGKVEIGLVGSKPFSSAPTLAYSLDSLHYKPIPLTGSGSNWAGYLIIPDDSGEAVGSFSFQGKDIEGYSGDEITQGKIFLVDTLSPRELDSVQAIGKDRSIELKWHSSDNVKQYRIYRSENPGVDYPDFLITSSGSSYADSSVQKGKTYFYKISAIDEAKNEGPLSVEVYATALLTNTTTNSGLSPSLLGSVDAVLSDATFLKETAMQIKQSFRNKDETSKDIYEYLKLERDIDNVVLEIQSVEREVSNYKTQSLTKTELDKKLSIASLKISSFKKRIPESVLVLSQKSGSRETNKESVEQVFLELNPEASNDEKSRTVDKSVNHAKETSFSVKYSAYNLALVYLDGSRKEMSLIKEQISSNLDKIENSSIFESIPETIAERAEEIDVKTLSYSVAKEDNVLQFQSDTKEILYVIPKTISLDSVADIQTILMRIDIENNEIMGTTGYSILDSIKGNYSFGLILGVIITLLLAGYFIFLKMGHGKIQEIKNMLEDISKAKMYIDNGDHSGAVMVYKELSVKYSKLSDKQKKEIYSQLNELYALISRTG